MTGRQKRAGDGAELEAARILTDLTGTPVRRLLGAGRQDDLGDLDTAHLGVAAQVSRVLRPADAATRMRSKVESARVQAARAGLAGHVALLRVTVGGRVVWRAGVTIDTIDRAETTVGDGPAWEAVVHGAAWAPSWVAVDDTAAVTTLGRWWEWWQTQPWRTEAAA